MESASRSREIASGSKTRFGGRFSYLGTGHPGASDAGRSGITPRRERARIFCWVVRALTWTFIFLYAAMSAISTFGVVRGENSPIARSARRFSVASETSVQSDERGGLWTTAVGVRGVSLMRSKIHARSVL